LPVTQTAEEALAQHRLVLETLLESTGDFIYMKDREGRYVFVNPAAAKSVGKSAEEIIGKDDRNLFPEEHARHIMEKDRQIMASGISEVFEETRAYADGVRHLHSSKNVCRDSSGAVIGIVGISRDITELKRAEEALNASELNAAGARMANALAHEINNPLAALTNALFLLRLRNGTTKEEEQLLGTAQESLWRVTKITRQMIGLYNRTAAARHIQVEDVVKDTLANLDSRIRKKGIRFTTDLSPCEFYGIDADIRQMITALMENAVEQSHSVVRIKLYNRPSGAAVRTEFRFIIADDGPGIAREHRDRIFEPFFSTKPEKGSGLGLWMARGIANKYGGSIRVRSRTTEGSSGTCVVVTMPTKRTVAKKMR